MTLDSNSISNAALGPAEASDKAGSFRARSIEEMIAAAKFEATQEAAASKKIGVRCFKIRGNGFVA